MGDAAQQKKTVDAAQAAKGCIIIVLAIAVVGFLAIAFFGEGDGGVANTAPPGPQKNELSSWTRAEAYGTCKHSAEQKLLSPGSAKWASAGDVQFIGSGNVLTVRATVDSQNVFGALIRQQMTCEVQKVGEDWKLLDMRIE